MLNPNLCPTHKCEMIEGVNKGRWALICDECKIELYNKITKLKEKAAKIKRIYKISKNPKLAELFEGL